MNKILRLDCSSRTTGSVSRMLGDYFEQHWKRRFPDARVIRRDLAGSKIPHISNTTIAGFYTPASQMNDELLDATALSDNLIDELNSVDVLLLTVPIYNFSIPSALKSWIDQIVRIGRTFSYDGKNFTGLVTGKKIFIISAYGAGGYLNSGPLNSYDFLKPYLKLLFGFLGITDIQFIDIEGTTLDEHIVKSNIDTAKRQIDALVVSA